MTNQNPLNDATDDEQPVIVDQVSIRAGTGLSPSGDVVGCVLLDFVNSVLPDVTFSIMYVGTAAQLRTAGDSLRGAFRHVANRVEPDARPRR